MERIKAKTSDFIAPYVVSCYDESRFCDLILVCEGNRDGFNVEPDIVELTHSIAVFVMKF